MDTPQSPFQSLILTPGIASIISSKCSAMDHHSFDHMVEMMNHAHYCDPFVDPWKSLNFAYKYRLMCILFDYLCDTKPSIYLTSSYFCDQLHKMLAAFEKEKNLTNGCCMEETLLYYRHTLQLFFEATCLEGKGNSIPCDGYME